MKIGNRITILLLFGVLNLFAQKPQPAYYEAVALAEQHFQVQQYLKAAQYYSKAFSANNDLGAVIHRYSAAQCWAAAGEIDSAFYQLNRISAPGYYSNYIEIAQDPKLDILHKDKRWGPLLMQIRVNKEKKDEKLNKPLVALLDSIHFDDQKYRKQIDEIENRFGRSSPEFEQLRASLERTDSINLVRVRDILDRYGWLGPEVVGEQGNSTLFLVIQHANIETQEEYLPMMREAVKSGKASPSGLALLEDRVAIRNGKKQIYGSQIGRNLNNGSYYVLPIEDPENVDKRRGEVKLPPMKDYVIRWGILWSLDRYEKDLKENL